MTDKKGGNSDGGNKGKQEQAGGRLNKRREDRAGFAISFDKPVPPAKPKEKKK